MQRFLTWLGAWLSADDPETRLPEKRPGLQVVPTTRPARRPARPEPPAKPAVDQPNLIDFDAELGGTIEDAGPGKNVLVRNKYLREETGTHETLKIVDDSVIDTGEAAGFDPYNTGNFDRSKTWKARTRE